MMVHISSHIKKRPWGQNVQVTYPKPFKTKMDLYDLEKFTQSLLIEVMQGKYGTVNQSQLTQKLKLVLANIH